MKKHYKAIRARMLEMDVDNGYLAKIIGISKSAVSTKLTCKAPWRSNEIHAVCKALKIPLEEALTKYFIESEAELISQESSKKEVKQERAAALRIV